MFLLIKRFSSRYDARFFCLAAMLVALSAGCHNNETDKNVQPAFPAVKNLAVVLPDNPGMVLKNIRSLFIRQVQQRCAAKVEDNAGSELTIVLEIEPGIGAEGFRIEDGKEGVIRIVGNDERGVLYGVGKFLRASAYGENGFSAGDWRGTSVPQKAVRGIYLATHFHNFYHVAPVEEIQRYVEDIALWGYNTLLVWYGMNHFNGFDDPDAVEFRKRLRLILKSAHDIGLDAAWGDVANAGYNDSPDSIRTTKFSNKGAQFDCDICPSSPGGEAYILKNAQKLLEEFAQINPKYYFIWPYDNGGCNSVDCRPWATNGYVRMSRLLGDQLRSYQPDAKIILSTWLFSSDERREFQTYLSKENSRGLVDYLISDADSVLGNAGSTPLLAFPEITMLGWAPWGGYGAAPLPSRYEKEWRKKSNVLSGGFPYSEGIYDDINKALYAQFYWQPDRSAENIIDEYIAFEFSPEVVGEMKRAIKIFEDNHAREEIKETAEDAFQLVLKSEAKLTAQAKKSWRWRIVYLRALIDHELYTIDPRPVFKQKEGNKNFAADIPQGEKLRTAFDELHTIYHAGKIDPSSANDVWLLPPQVEIP